MCLDLETTVNKRFLMSCVSALLNLSCVWILRRLWTSVSWWAVCQLFWTFHVFGSWDDCEQAFPDELCVSSFEPFMCLDLETTVNKRFLMSCVSALLNLSCVWILRWLWTSVSWWAVCQLFWTFHVFGSWDDCEQAFPDELCVSSFEPFMCLDLETTVNKRFLMSCVSALLNLSCVWILRRLWTSVSWWAVCQLFWTFHVFGSWDDCEQAFPDELCVSSFEPFMCLDLETTVNKRFLMSCVSALLNLSCVWILRRLWTSVSWWAVCQLFWTFHVFGSWDDCEQAFPDELCVSSFEPFMCLDLETTVNKRFLMSCVSALLNLSCVWILRRLWTSVSWWAVCQLFWTFHVFGSWDDCEQAFPDELCVSSFEPFMCLDLETTVNKRFLMSCVSALLNLSCVWILRRLWTSVSWWAVCQPFWTFHVFGSWDDCEQAFPDELCVSSFEPFMCLDLETTVNKRFLMSCVSALLNLSCVWILRRLWTSVSWWAVCQLFWTFHVFGSWDDCEQAFPDELCVSSFEPFMCLDLETTVNKRFLMSCVSALLNLSCVWILRRLWTSVSWWAVCQLFWTFHVFGSWDDCEQAFPDELCVSSFEPFMCLDLETTVNKRFLMSCVSALLNLSCVWILRRLWTSVSWWAVCQLFWTFHVFGSWDDCEQAFPDELCVSSFEPFMCLDLETTVNKRFLMSCVSALLNLSCVWILRRLWTSVSWWAVCQLFWTFHVFGSWDDCEQAFPDELCVSSFEPFMCLDLETTVNKRFLMSCVSALLNLSCVWILRRLWTSVSWWAVCQLFWTFHVFGSWDDCEQAFPDELCVSSFEPFMCLDLETTVNKRFLMSCVSALLNLSCVWILRRLWTSVSWWAVCQLFWTFHVFGSWDDCEQAFPDELCVSSFEPFMCLDLETTVNKRFLMSCVSALLNLSCVWILRRLWTSVSWWAVCQPFWTFHVFGSWDDCEQAFPDELCVSLLNLSCVWILRRLWTSVSWWAVCQLFWTFHVFGSWDDCEQAFPDELCVSSFEPFMCLDLETTVNKRFLMSCVSALLNLSCVWILRRLWTSVSWWAVCQLFWTFHVFGSWDDCEQAFPDELCVSSFEPFMCLDLETTVNKRFLMSCVSALLNLSCVWILRRLWTSVSWWAVCQLFWTFHVFGSWDDCEQAFPDELCVSSFEPFMCLDLETTVNKRFLMSCVSALLNLSCVWILRRLWTSVSWWAVCQLFWTFHVFGSWDDCEQAFPDELCVSSFEPFMCLDLETTVNKRFLMSCVSALLNLSCVWILRRLWTSVSWWAVCQLFWTFHVFGSWDDCEQAFPDELCVSSFEPFMCLDLETTVNKRFLMSCVSALLNLSCVWILRRLWTSVSWWAVCQLFWTFHVFGSWDDCEQAFPDELCVSSFEPFMCLDLETTVNKRFLMSCVSALLNLSCVWILRRLWTSVSWWAVCQLFWTFHVFGSWDDCEQAFPDELCVSSFPSHAMPGQQRQHAPTLFSQGCICV